MLLIADTFTSSLQARVEEVADADLKDAYETERHLLHVACTRARDYLLVTGLRPWSEFLEDLGRSTAPLTDSFL